MPETKNGTDYGQSNRKDSYRFVLVDPFSLEEVGTVEPDPASCNLTFGYYTDNKVQGNLTLKKGDYQIDGYDKMIRIYHTVHLSGDTFEYCMCTLFVDSASSSSVFKNSSTSLACYSALWRFTQDVVIQDFYRPKGYNVVGEIRELVEIDGGKLKVGPEVDQNKLHTMDICFDLGTSRAEVLNTIAGWINCEINVDPYGYITLDKYVSPHAKSVSYTFVEGKNCVYTAGYDLSDNRNEPINRVKVYYSREKKPVDADGNPEDPYPLTDSVLIESPDNDEFSFAKCGRRKAQIIKLNEPCSTAELYRVGMQYLNENNYSTKYIQFKHVGIPFLYPGMKIRYINSTDSDNVIDIDGLITEMSISSLTPGCMTTSKVRIVRYNV